MFLENPSHRLVFPDAADPLVSVLIVTHNKAEYTLRCLESILAYADGSFEVIIVDNASADETPKLLERLVNGRVLVNTENEHFIHGSNRAARLARGEYLLFLNNDAFVQAGTLPALLETVERDASAGAAGAKLVWPNGRLQEAGSILWRDGSAVAYGRDEDPAAGEFSYLREADFCSAACLLVRRRLFEQLGGFDSRYAPAYYEDADLCMGIRNLGFRVLYQPKAVATHAEFTSSSQAWAERLCKQNQPKFAQKWSEVLSSRHLPHNPDRVLWARDRNRSEGILVFDDRIPAPNLGSGFPRMFALLETLARLGYRITFVPLQDPTRIEPDTGRLQQVGIEVLYGKTHLSTFLRRRGGLYETVLVSRPHNAVQIAPLLPDLMSDATFVYDAEALFYRREVLRSRLMGRSEPPKRALALKQAELSLIAKADKVLVVSEAEAAQVRPHLAPGSDIRVWGHAVPIRPPQTAFAQRQNLLFVGGFLGRPSPNEDAVVHFTREVFPQIQEALPEIRLLVAGVHPPRGVRKLASDSVRILGSVTDLRPYYESCRVFVNPARYGAGIALKVLEAMSFGIPSVTSEFGASGLDLRDGVEALIATSPVELAEMVVALYTDEKLWHRLQQGAFEYLSRHCDPDRMAHEILDLLGSPERRSRESRGEPRSRLDSQEVMRLRKALVSLPFRLLPLRVWQYYRRNGFTSLIARGAEFARLLIRRP